MHKQNRFVQVLLPSLSSGTVTVLLSVATLGIATFSYLSGSGLIYDYWFGPHSSVELLSSSQGSVSTFNNIVFGNPVLNKILYFAFWMLVGLIVYFILFTFIKGASTAVEDIEEAGYKNARLHEMMQNFVSRMAIRIAFVILWAMYWVFFIKILVPFSVLSTRIGIVNFPQLTSWLYLIFATLVLSISLHIHLIFLRLIALRVRLIDSGDIVN